MVSFVCAAVDEILTLQENPGFPLTFALQRQVGAFRDRGRTAKVVHIKGMEFFGKCGILQSIYIGALKLVEDWVQHFGDVLASEFAEIGVDEGVAVLNLRGAHCAGLPFKVMYLHFSARTCWSYAKGPRFEVKLASLTCVDNPVAR